MSSLKPLISADDRYFINDNPDWDEIVHKNSHAMNDFDDNLQQVLSVLSSKDLNLLFIDYISSFLRHILKNYNPSDEHSGSIYIGVSGFCVLFLRIIRLIDEYDQSNEEFKNNNESNVNHTEYQRSQWDILMKKLCKICKVKNMKELREYLLLCIRLYNDCALNDFESRKHQRYSLLEGIAGAYAVRIVYYYYMQSDEKMTKYIQKLKHLAKDVQHMDEMELLYGRMGYISAFLFVHHYIGNYKNLNLLSCKEVIFICESVIESGKEYVKIANESSQNDFFKKTNIPMMWEWYQSQYFGGAHGVAGIVLTLICIPQIVQKHKEILIQMIDSCREIRFKSGNFPSSVRGFYQQRDTLVQFCHGAVGFVAMYNGAMGVFGNKKYAHYAESASDIVWERGLLRKGESLCHGISGNAYTFLSCYRMSGCKDLKHLYRAMRFAEVMMRFADKNDIYARLPDRPDSLFEGRCGGVHFILDVLFAAETATFPCYEWLA